MGKRWSSKISSQLEILAFQGHGIEAGLSANGPYVFTAKMTDHIDGTIAKCLRMFEPGEATDWTGAHAASLPRAAL
eukprot:8277306-Pyramimonas_sp.AAC.1